MLANSELRRIRGADGRWSCARRFDGLAAVYWRNCSDRERVSPDPIADRRTADARAVIEGTDRTAGSEHETWKASRFCPC